MLLRLFLAFFVCQLTVGNVSCLRNDIPYMNYEQPMFINVTTLTISSMTFNPTPKTSQWISHLFGDEAVFYNRTDMLRSPKPLTRAEKLERIKLFHEKYRLPPEFKLPACSFEMLGFAVVTEEPPLSFAHSGHSPSIGSADLTFYLKDDQVLWEDPGEPVQRETWKCVWRAMYDNTFVKNNLKLRPNHFWPVFLYCPAPKQDDSCFDLVNIYRHKLKRILINESRKKNHLKPQDIQPLLPDHEDISVDGSMKGLEARRKLESLASNRNKNNNPLTNFARSLLSINKITNAKLLGLRSFHILPGISISKSFLIQIFHNILGIEKFSFPLTTKLPENPSPRTAQYFINRKFRTPSDEIYYPNNLQEYNYYDLKNNNNHREETSKEETKEEEQEEFPFPNIFISAKLSFHLSSSTWNLPIEIDLVNIERKPISEDLAVCSIIPYASSDDMKVDINGAMIYDFIRYYHKLGFKIMLFDRNGRHYSNIFESSYAKRHNQHNQGNKKTGENEFGDSLLYYNYTILQLLKGYPIDVRYENDIGLSPAVVYTDFDKRFTYTYCRFALKHLYGIENVLINDFDEFLYCPQGTSNVEKQKEFQKSYFHHLKSKGIDQLFMKQRVLVSKENNLKDCMQRKIDATTMATTTSNSLGLITTKPTISEINNPNISIFECLSPFKFEVKSFFDKTFHFSHACPYTFYHYSSYLRFFDCYAQTYLTASQKKRDYTNHGCSVIHFTTRVATYNRSHSFSNMEHMYKNGINEIHTILNS